MSAGKELRKVVIDARMVEPIPHGISRYVTHLAAGLRKIQPELPYLPVFLIHQESQKDCLSGFPVAYAQSPFLSLKEITEIPKILEKEGATVYHSPSFSSLWNCPCPGIVTIHDLNHLTYGNLFKKLYYKIILRRFAKSCEKVLTVSEFSRKEIAEWLSLPEKDVEVVYNAVEPPLNKQPVDALELELLKKHRLEKNQYFFCLSNPKPHKNLPLLISAYEKYQKIEQSPWPLVLNIQGPESVPGIRAIGGVSSMDAEILLKHSAGVLFPSLYEGFGLPPVEAALAGSPLAVSSIPPHREGLIDLTPHEVLWIEPNDLNGWVNAFQQLQMGKVKRSSPEQRRQIAERFSVQRLGIHMDQIYRRVLELKL